MDTLRQLQIKTGTAKRLCADVRNYSKEKEDLETALATQVDKHAIKKQRELIEETESTLRDLRVRLQDAYNALLNFVNDVKGKSGISGSEDLDKSNKVLHDCKPFVSNSHLDLDDEKKAKLLKVVVFGSSRCVPGDELYTLSEQVGSKLASLGYHIITGGYGGTMEGVSKGASQFKSAVIEGIITPTVFPARGAHGNQYLTKETIAPDLQQRLCSLIYSGDIFVALPGNIGTLTELMMAWNVQAIAHLSGKRIVPIFAFRNPWEQAVKGLESLLSISPSDMQKIIFVDSAEDLINNIHHCTQN